LIVTTQTTAIHSAAENDMPVAQMVEGQPLALDKRPVALDAYAALYPRLTEVRAQTQRSFPQDREEVIMHNMADIT
jgi:hypothetical protein